LDGVAWRASTATSEGPPCEAAKLQHASVHAGQPWLNLDPFMHAAGIVDGYWEYRLKPWDVAAGVLVAEEAGARVTTMTGEPFSVSVPSPACARVLAARLLHFHDSV